ncbi:MAG: dephospho-CoA kinase [Betaproteobacteria bacterium]|nr:MAG: dephospho-CoA kinase [Betaproteobacteria bacterium]
MRGPARRGHRAGGKVQPFRSALALPGVRPHRRRGGKHPARLLGDAAWALLGVQSAHQFALPAGRAPRRRRRGLGGGALRLQHRGVRRDGVPVVHRRRELHRFRYPAAARFDHAAALVAGIARQCRRHLRRPAFCGDRRGCWISRPLDCVLGVQARNRQGGDGIRRFQAARRNWRVVRVAGFATHDPAVVLHRGGRWNSPHGFSPARPQRSDSLRAVFGRRRDRRTVLGTADHPPILQPVHVKPYTVGLTGGIASGKSVVAGLFAKRGVTVIDTDEIAHELTRPGGEAIGAIRSAFGASVIDADGALDRDGMRRLVFGDAAARKRLEAILHPLIRMESARRRDRAPGPYAILVVPLLVESGVERSRYARVLVVDCPEGQQVERAMRRSGLSETEVRAILAAQATREQRLAQADDVIDNSGTPEALEDQVSNLNEKYLTLAARSKTTS